jgi:hypothetical protein
VDLNSLFVEVDDTLSHEDLLSFAEQLFRTSYAPNGSFGRHRLHDGQFAIFYGDRWEHATHTSTNLAKKPTDKSKLDRTRIGRLPWIAPLIAGQVTGSYCYEVQGDRGRVKRLYAFTPGRIMPYVVWLEPTSRDWKFSSAYLTPHEVLKRYISSSVLLTKF